MIPSIIHQIWLDPPIDPKAIPYMNISKTMSNEYKLWTSENVWNEIGKTREEFAQYWNLDLTNAVGLSDVLRVLLIKKLGGWYVDSDVEIFKNVDDYKNNSFVTNTEYSPVRVNKVKVKKKFKEKEVIVPDTAIANEFFGSKPDHPFLILLIERMEEQKNSNIHWTRTIGYLMFWETIKNYKGYDITYLSKERSAVFMKHHFFNSWCSKYGEGK